MKAKPFESAYIKHGSRNIHVHLALASYHTESKPGFPIKGSQGQVEVYIAEPPIKLPIAPATQGCNRFARHVDNIFSWNCAINFSEDYAGRSFCLSRLLGGGRECLGLMAS